jgi:endonuclease/exonuclease/phosphatase family metal-dependent hydrolase
MLSLATYNILHGYHEEQILKNLSVLISKGAEIICLQEVDIPFEKPLNNFLNNFPEWHVRYFHEGSGCNLALLWNTSKMALNDIRNVFLPKPDDSCCQRGAQVASFDWGNEVVRISNVHLSWEGGMSHRFRQLKYLKNQLETSEIQNEIICGDFNTFAPALLRNIQKRKIAETLGNQWKDVLPNMIWTCDVSHSYPPDKFHWISITLKRFGFRLRSCLDYILIKNLVAKEGRMIDVPGSDHRPLLVQLHHGN